MGAAGLSDFGCWVAVEFLFVAREPGATPVVPAAETVAPVLVLAPTALVGAGVALKALPEVLPGTSWPAAVPPESLLCPCVDGAAATLALGFVALGVFHGRSEEVGFGRTKSTA